METKRQKQISSIVKRHFSAVLQQEGAYIYGLSILVTVTDVKVSPDLSLAKIYLSIFNTEDKQSVILLMEENNQRLYSQFAQRVRKHLRRAPHLDYFIDDTLDEQERIDKLFSRLEKDKQMGSSSEVTED